MEDKKPQQKHAGGRPPTWTDPKILEKLINEYFKREVRPTLSGLAVSLDIDRRTLWNYGQKDKFFPVIKAARERVEEIYEQHLIYSDKPTGVIFALKNMGWKDRSDITTDDKELPAPIYGGKSQT